MCWQAGLGVGIWNAATPEPNIVWEGRQLESKKPSALYWEEMFLKLYGVIHFL
jgi:hypothetical protein